MLSLLPLDKWKGVLKKIDLTNENIFKEVNKSRYIEDIRLDVFIDRKDKSSSFDMFSITKDVEAGCLYFREQDDEPPDYIVKEMKIGDITVETRLEILRYEDSRNQTNYSIWNQNNFCKGDMSFCLHLYKDVQIGCLNLHQITKENEDLIKDFLSGKLCLSYIVLLPGRYYCRTRQGTYPLSYFDKSVIEVVEDKSLSLLDKGTLFQSGFYIYHKSNQEQDISVLRLDDFFIGNSFDLIPLKKGQYEKMYDFISKSTVNEFLLKIEGRE